MHLLRSISSFLFLHAPKRAPATRAHTAWIADATPGFLAPREETPMEGSCLPCLLRGWRNGLDEAAFPTSRRSLADEAADMAMQMLRVRPGLASHPRRRRGGRRAGPCIRTRAQVQEGRESLELHVGGGTLRFETGEVGRQANGAVMATSGETVRGRRTKDLKHQRNDTRECNGWEGVHAQISSVGHR